MNEEKVESVREYNSKERTKMHFASRTSRPEKLRVFHTKNLQKKWPCPTRSTPEFRILSFAGHLIGFC